MLLTLLGREYNRTGKKNFKPKSKSIISLIRLACHYHEVKEILPLINWLKNQDIKLV